MQQAILGSVMLLMLALASPAMAATFTWSQVNGKWHLTHPVYANQYTGSGNSTIAATYAAMSDTDLRARVTTAGIPPGSSNTNAQAKNAAYYLARRYTETGNTLYAHKAAILLQRFAEVFPSWPFYSSGGTAYPQSGTPPYNGSMWGSTWYYYDLNQPALQIALAWDIIQDTAELEALGSGVRQQIETDLIERNIKIYTERYPRGFGNVDADLLHGLMIWGLVSNDPAVIHKGSRWASEQYRVSWYPSGAWHEALGSYLLMIGNRLEWAILNNPLKGYSDPPGWTYPQDGVRYDNLNMEAELLTPRTNVANVMRKSLLPNARFVAIHDSDWDETSSRSGLPASVKNYVPTVQHPYILPDFGHAILAGGSGTAQSQVHLHFSGTHGHAHLDNLNLILYAKGKELFSETAYEDAYDSTREWHEATAGHNTVVIDQKNQTESNYRTIVPALDGIPEVPDYPLTSSDFGGWHHLSMNKGNLQLWEVKHDPVQIAEASAEKAYYPTSLSIYRRTLSRIVSDGSDFYVVDIFRVKGGTTHDWMLHGNLEEAYTIETPLAMNTASGTIHSYITLTKSLTTANPLEFRFVSPGGEIVRTLMTAAAGTQAMIGQGPAMRRSGTAPFLDIRRTGSSDVFAAVHEPYTSQARVSQISQLTPLTGSSTNAVALKIELVDRTDYFLSTMDPTEKAIVTDGALNITLDGHIGYVTVQGGVVTKLYLVDGSRLEAGGQTVTATGYNGTVTASYSKTSLLRTPDAMNAFEVSDTTLPVGTALKGRTILLTDGEGRTHGFEIDSVTRNGDKSLVMLASDPGVKIGNGVYKKLYFPSWGVPGTVTYHVAGTALDPPDLIPVISPNDNRLVERTPTTIYAASSFLDVGHLTSYDKRYRDLIWFDLGAYSGSVKQAILSLYWYHPASATRTNDTIVDIYRPVMGWDHTYVSWNNKANGTAWTNPGGDWFDKNGTAQGSVPYASVTLSGSQVPDNKYYAFDVTSLVNEYLASGQNAGFFIKARAESDNYIAFAGLSATDAATRPKLVVTPEPVTVWLPGGGPAQIHAGDGLTVAWKMDLPVAGSTILLKLYNGATLVADLGSFTNAAGADQSVVTLPSSLTPGDNYFIRGVSFSNQTLWADTPFMSIAERPETPPYDNRITDRTPTTVYAASTFLDLGHLVSSDKKYRDLVWFDLSAYDDASMISQATLTLYWYYPSVTRTNDTIVEIYRPAADWNHDYVCWTNKTIGSTWTNPGGDWFDKNGTAQGSVPYASIAFTASQAATNQYYSFNVTDLVKEYIDSGQNAGFFIKARTENDNYFAFYGLSATDAATRPKLNVTLDSDAWVNFLWVGAELGSQSKPYNTLAEGVLAVAPARTLHIQTGETGETARVVKAMRIVAENGLVRLGAAAGIASPSSRTPTVSPDRTSTLNWMLIK